MEHQKFNGINPPVYFPPTAPMLTNQQNPQYYPAQPQQVFVQQAPVLGPDSVSTTCPNCHARIVTEVSDFSTNRTHSMAFLIALLGCICGCCLIPYCTKSFQSQKHTCPMCRSVIGIYKN